MTQTVRSRLKAGVALAAIFAQLAVTAGPASAFCGFYVAEADAKLFNKSSKVVIARDGDETAITMASDYEGKPDEFALVVPVPDLHRERPDQRRRSRRRSIISMPTRRRGLCNITTKIRASGSLDVTRARLRFRFATGRRSRRRRLPPIPESRSRRVTTWPNTTFPSCQPNRATA